MIRESERLTRLINQVLDLAKIESGHLVTRIEPTRLPTLLDDVKLLIPHQANLPISEGVQKQLKLPDDVVVADHPVLGVVPSGRQGVLPRPHDALVPVPSHSELFGGQVADLVGQRPFADAGPDQAAPDDLVVVDDHDCDR